MSNPPKNDILNAPKGNIVIRMYRSGFGDCFLLAFAAKNNITKYMLIDCGVHHNYPDKQELLNNIAAQIQKATGGHLDIVAVTHEHTDHILGFSLAKGPTYCTPGQPPLTIDGVDDMRIYVLGPPTNETLLKKSDPSKGAKKETYLSEGSTDLYDAFVESVLNLGPHNPNTPTKAPFSDIYGKKIDKANTWFHTQLYKNNDNDWRKIDQQYLELASELAIKMEIGVCLAVFSNSIAT